MIGDKMRELIVVSVFLVLVLVCAGANAGVDLLENEENHHHSSPLRVASSPLKQSLKDAFWDIVSPQNLMTVSSTLLFFMIKPASTQESGCFLAEVDCKTSVNPDHKYLCWTFPSFRGKCYTTDREGYDYMCIPEGDQCLKKGVWW